VLPAGDVALGGTSLADEAVTLAAAFQRGGFRQVIGTMWRPPDELPPVADRVYDGLGPPGATTPAAAVALDRAVTELRREHPDEPWRWAPYFHLGP
jgi:CHAT domain-containing protein